MKHRQLWQMSIVMVSLVVMVLSATPAVASQQVDYYVYLPIVMKTPAHPIYNGDFEAGGDGSWIETSSHGWDLINQGLPSGAAPHSGSWAAWLGGGYFELSNLEQTNLTLNGMRYLHYWYWIVSQDTCGNDFTKIYVNGVVLKTIDLCDATATTGWVEDVIDLNSYVGKSLSLKIETSLNGSFHSNLYLDDVSFK